MTERGDTGWRLAAMALAWLAGVAVHLQLRSLPTDSEAWALTIAGGLALGMAWRWRRTLLVLGALGAALLAFGAADLRASARQAEALGADLEGVDLVVTGVVASLPQRSPAGLRFPFQVEAATGAGQPVQVPPTLTVGWYKPPHAGDSSAGRLKTLGAGQRWRFTLRLRQPHGNLNPHGFDYELQLFEQGVGATASVREKPAPALLDPAAGFPVERLRQRVRDAIEAHVPDRRAAGMLAALSVGDQGAIDRGS